MDIHADSAQEANVAKRLKNLVKASQSLAGIESLDDLLQQLLDLAQEVTDAEATSHRGTLCLQATGSL